MKRIGGERAGLCRPIWLALMSVAALTATTKPATALTWNWSYSGAGIAASGTFTTVDTPDGSGSYLMTGIAGVRNGAAILGLQPAGTPIPGNELFSVDNLVRVESPQLTVHGFGYAIAGGTFSNPFFARFLQPPEYLEFFSAPPFTPGVAGPEDSELPIRFSAAPAPVPEAATWALLLAGLGMFGLATRFATRRLECLGRIGTVEPGRVVNAELHGQGSCTAWTEWWRNTGKSESWDRAPSHRGIN
jgi:hypothetical protein